MEGFWFAWDFLVAVVLIIQKLAEEWPGLHVCVKSPCRTSGCPAELLWPDMDGTGATYVHTVPQEREGPGWALLQCWCSWPASKSHVKLVMELTRHYSALLQTTAARVHVVLALTGVGNWSMEAKVKKLRLWGSGQ